MIALQDFNGIKTFDEVHIYKKIVAAILSQMSDKALK